MACANRMTFWDSTSVFGGDVAQFRVRVDQDLHQPDELLSFAFCQWLH
jgi:hypothetical protein